jgi:hypothetical protein
MCGCKRLVFDTVYFQLTDIKSDGLDERNLPAIPQGDLACETVLLNPVNIFTPEMVKARQLYNMDRVEYTARLERLIFRLKEHYAAVNDLLYQTVTCTLSLLYYATSKIKFDKHQVIRVSRVDYTQHNWNPAAPFIPMLDAAALMLRDNRHTLALLYLVSLVHSFSKQKNIAIYERMKKLHTSSAHDIRCQMLSIIDDQERGQE